MLQGEAIQAELQDVAAKLGKLDVGLQRNQGVAQRAAEAAQRATEAAQQAEEAQQRAEEARRQAEAELDEALQGLLRSRGDPDACRWAVPCRRQVAALLATPSLLRGPRLQNREHSAAPAHEQVRARRLAAPAAHQFQGGVSRASPRLRPAGACRRRSWRACWQRRRRRRCGCGSWC